ncbi:MAG TPA: glycoside hydrolase family 88 protein [Phototrophicaceae bacterium]|nr:glycoside hydrolase family 88 protein [Phototrophicaceae bacterium]
MLEQQSWAVRTAQTVIKRQPILGTKWAYEWGVVLKGVEQVWLETRQPAYLDYVQINIDTFVQPDGSILTYSPQEYNLDHINTGKLLFSLFRMTGAARYEKALHRLREQLNTHPRTSERGFWHKNIYPQQMWLDGIYMAGPFLAEYGRTFNQPADFDEVVQQIVLIESHTRDAQTGLLYHGWDESRTQQWANPETGCSPHFWGRAIGWYVMALAEVLELLPEDHAGRPPVTAILNRTLDALLRAQDPTSGLWYQVLDQGHRAGNYLEASASSMMVYALAKTVLQSNTNPNYQTAAETGYNGIVKQLIETDAEGSVNVNRICSVAGLGSTPYRDGSYEYYISEPVVSNDYKGVGAFILASVEIERLRQGRAVKTAG